MTKDRLKVMLNSSIAVEYLEIARTFFADIRLKLRNRKLTKGR